MKLVELFCGAGGFSRGAHAAGFEVAVAYDLDETLTSSYSLNFPNTKLRHRDVSKLKAKQIRADAGGEIVGVYGGPPCQGFSDIGRRDKSDPRRKLLGHFFRIVEELQPEFFIMENVRGLAYADSLPLLTRALDRIRPNYDITEPRIWNAADFGAATVRNRMFVIGIRKDLKKPFDNARLERRQCRPATVAQAIADLESAVPLPAIDKLVGFDRWKIVRRGAPSTYASELRAADRTFTGHMPTEHTPKVVERFSKVAQGTFDVVGRHPRLKLDGQCPTLRAGTGADKGSYQAVRPIHPTLNRVITVREAARLQGFPDDHIFHPTIWHSFRMIGNSVSPVMSRAVFEAIREHLESSDAATDSSADASPSETAMGIAAE